MKGENSNKNTVKSFLTICLLLLLLPLFAGAASAETNSGSCGENLTWSYDAETAVLTISGSGDMYDYSSDGLAPWYEGYRDEIQTVVIEKGITNIGNCAFLLCRKITKVTIADSVTAIGANAFASCTKLQNIEIPNSVLAIGESAFDCCGRLMEISIPDSVVSIDNYAFSNCYSIQDINVGTDNAVYSSLDGVLFNKDQSELILYPGGKTAEKYTIPDSVTCIAQYALASSSLSNIEVSDNIISVGRYAFVLTTWYNNQPDGLVYLNKTLVGYKGELPADTMLEIKDGTKCIADLAFTWSEELIKVTIPDSVESIGCEAFRYCKNINALTIGNSVINIGESAFDECDSIINLIVPDSVIRIGDFAFKSCDSLRTITFGNSVKSIGESAFYNCNLINNVVLPDSLTVIGESAFDRCGSLSNVIIGNGVTNIGKSAFHYCQELCNVILPAGLVCIGDSAFNRCSRLDYAYFQGNIPEDLGVSVFDDCANDFKIYYKEGVGDWTTPEWNGYLTEPLPVNGEVTGTCGENANWTYNVLNYSLTISGSGEMYDYSSDACAPWYKDYRNKIKTIAIQKGITNIGTYGFYDCSNMTKVTIADSVTAIEASAFRYCGQLRDIEIPGKVLDIGEAAFNGCFCLTEITIPDSVTKIGRYVFQYCDSLENIIVGADNTAYSSVDGVLFNKNKSQLIVYPAGKTAEAYTIPDNAAVISSEAFANCRYLSSIEIPNSVTSIGAAAFADCGSLNNITMSDNVTTMGQDAFKNTAWYSNLPEGLVYLNKILVGYKGEVPAGTIIEINEGIKCIAGHAFIFGSGLIKVLIPDSVIEIGYGAFYSCDNLSEVTIGKGVIRIGESAFADCNHIDNIIIPDSVLQIEQSSFSNCNILSNVHLGSSVTSIGKYAFYCCTNLTSITLPADVVSIGEAAFNRCYNLDYAHFQGDAPENFENYVFDGCTVDFFRIYFDEGKSGWTTPTWNGYSAKPYPTAATALILDQTSEEINLAEGEDAWLSFTPTESGSYKLHSLGNSATRCELLDSNLSVLTSDGGDTGNFEVRYFLNAGETYYYCCFDQYDNAVTFKVTLEKYGLSTSGSCGEKLTWSYDAVSATLSISGSGEMYDFAYDDFAPWYKELRNQIKVVILENGITNIGSYAFFDCNKLRDITLPNSIIEIAAYAFYGCQGLTSITIPDGVADIRNSAFCCCSYITEVSIPSSVTNIEDGVFQNCYCLMAINVDEDNSVYSSINGVLCDKAQSTLVFYPKGILNESYTIPDNITVIDKMAFQYCYSLKEINIPSDVTQIGMRAFEGCDNLNNVKLSANLNTIGASAFASCSSLSEIIIPASLTALGDSAFKNDAALSRALFKGNAPEPWLDTIFEGTAADFEIQYYEDMSGWGTQDKLTPIRISGIEIVSLPNKTVYIQADEINATGLSLKVNYDDEYSRTITTGFDLDYDFSSAGEKAVTVSYSGQKTSFNVTVNAVEKTLDNISAQYNQGSSVFYVTDNLADKLSSITDKLVVKAHYADGSSQTLTASQYELAGDLSVIDADNLSTLTVTYTEDEKTESITFTVKISDLALAEWFPDTSFCSYVYTTVLGQTASDGSAGSYALSLEDISTIAAWTEIDVADKAVSSLHGIERFKSLQVLNCQNNNIAELDISGCTALQELNCSSNRLPKLALTNNTALTSLDCSNNVIEGTLDVSKLAALTSLNCSANKLTGLTVSGCSALAELNCSNNGIEGTLDVSNFINLTNLNCSANKLTGLTVSGCSALAELNCSNNGIEGTLDVSNFTGLTNLDCSYNQLTGLTVSGCSALAELNCSHNAISGTLDVSNFASLTNLDCSYNQLTGLTVSGCNALAELDCSDNSIGGTLNVSSLTALKNLNCSSNVITGTLDAGELTTLVNLNCSNNELTALNVNNCSALITLDCSKNKLTRLDTSTCTELQLLICSNNEITELITNAPVVQVQVKQRSTEQQEEQAVSLAANGSKLKQLDCSNNKITVLALDNFPELESLNVSNTEITTLNLNSNEKLTSLDVSGCSNLKEVNSKLTFKGVVDGDKVIVDLSAEAAKGTISYTESSGTVYDSTNNTVTFSSKEVAAAGFDYTLTITNSDDSETRLIVDGSVIYVSALSITTEANVKTYYVGDSLSTDGITLQAAYSDNKTIEEISDGFTAEAAASNCSDNKFTAAGDAVQVDLFYKGCSTEYTVVVKDLPVTEIAEVTFQQAEDKDYDIVTVKFGLALTQPSGYIIVAAYDDNNQMLASSLKQVYSGDTSTECIIRGAANYATLKAFMVNDLSSCQPLTAALAAPVVQ